MEQTEKRILRGNIIKFIIGIVLLGFSVAYMSNHQAERASIFSGFEVLWQKLSVKVYQIAKGNSQELQKKYDYEKTYQELINMGESKDCVDPNVMTTLNETFIALKKEPIKTLEVNLP
jgi:hypothetical protein